MFYEVRNRYAKHYYFFIKYLMYNLDIFQQKIFKIKYNNFIGFGHTLMQRLFIKY